jgi:hypothetical protein
MAEVPEGSSGIGSGLFNACRQIGTAMGLAILGSIGASVILADWHRQSGSFPPAERQSAAQAGADVAGGQVHAVAASVGRLALDPAVSSFLRGFGLALLLAGATLTAASLVGFLGLRHLPSPAPRRRQPTDGRTGRLTGFLTTTQPGTTAQPLRAREPHFKAPRTVIFAPLPKTSTGKIQKQALRDQARSSSAINQPG